MSLTVEVSTREQGEKICGIEEVDGYPCEVQLHVRYNYRKGLIFLYEFDLDSIEEFEEELQCLYNKVDVQPATFIKRKLSQTQVFLVTF